MYREDYKMVESACGLGWLVFGLFFGVFVPFSTICLFFPSFNDDLGTMPTRRPYSWKKNLAPERPACWSKLKRLVQQSCETRSVPCHTHHRSCHLVSRAPHCLLLLLPSRGHRLPKTSLRSVLFWFSILRLSWQSLQASIARQVEYLQGPL